MNPPDIRTTLLPKMLEQQQGGLKPEREAQHGPPGKKRVLGHTVPENTRTL